jgi:hypothetical protein
MATPLDPAAVTVPEADGISLKRSLTLFAVWLKNHKYTTASSVEIEGSRGSREASGLELLISGVIETGISLGTDLANWVTGGGGNGVGSLMPGDSIGVQPPTIPDPEWPAEVPNPLYDPNHLVGEPEFIPNPEPAPIIPNPSAGAEYIIPGPVRSTLTSIGAKVAETVKSFQLGTDQSTSAAYDSVKDNGTMCINPVKDEIAKSSISLSSITDNIKAGADGAWTAAKDKFHAFTDALSGVRVGTDGYTLGDAFKAADDYVVKTTNAFEVGVRETLGLKNFSVADFAGSLVDKTLLPNFNEKLNAYIAAKKDPEITEEQLAILEAEVDAAAQALSDQVDRDNANYLEHIAQQTALEAATNTGSTYNSAPDEHKELYASTLRNPEIATGISSQIDTGKQLQNDSIPS